MSESIFTISVVGLFAGFIFSMPIAGPVSILITSNAFKGRLAYCNSLNFGASLATFTYVFFAVFGLTKLYNYYKPAIPYLFSAGSIFLLILGYRIFRSKFDVENYENKDHFTEKINRKKRGGFYTGFIINLLNPTLFIGWLSSTFFVISFTASLGLNSGGLDIYVNQGVEVISNVEDSISENSTALALKKVEITKESGNAHHHNKLINFPAYFHLLVSVFYALFISVGSLIWFYFLALLIARFRQYIKIKIISVFIKSMGIVLCLFGLYFGYLAAKILFNMHALQSARINIIESYI